MPRSAFSPVQEKAIAECFYECASGYDIKTGDGNTALAVPKTKTCTKDGLVAKCWPRFASQHHFFCGRSQVSSISDSSDTFFSTPNLLESEE